jgi:hypothetical protein
MIPEKNAIITIEQRAFMRGHQKFEICPNGELQVTIKRFNTLNQFKFPLWHLDPSPARVKLMQSGNLLGAIIFGLCTLGTIAGMIASRDVGIAAALGFPLFLFGMLFFACYSKMITTAINAKVFHYRGNNNGIHIWFEKPDAKTFNEFCETLSKKSEEAWNNRPIEPAPQSLAGELAALKKLKDSGVLNDAEFERAKSNLLGQAEQKKIGFA